MSGGVQWISDNPKRLDPCPCRGGKGSKCMVCLNRMILEQARVVRGSSA